MYRYPAVNGSGWISGHFSLSSSWQWRNWTMKPKILLTYYFVDYSLVSWLHCCSLYSNQDITSSNMKLVTLPTQLSRCQSQTSTVPELLSAHSDGVVDSTVSVSQSIRQYPISSKFWFGRDSRFNYPATIWFRPHSQKPYPAHAY